MIKTRELKAPKSQGKESVVEGFAKLLIYFIHSYKCRY